jgi:uncharacterized spore protein YtfJ
MKSSLCRKTGKGKTMDTVAKLLKETVEELERLLNARNVLGDPIEREDATVIPIVSYGFGFGAGGSADNEADKAGFGGGAGAGGGIKPIGAIIMDHEGARVEAIKGAASNWTEVVGEAAAQVIRAASSRRRDSDANSNTPDS